jgi:tryptophan synthase alpha chain
MLEESPPMNRIDERFAGLRKEKRKGFIVYIGAGDPDLDATRNLALEFDRLGVDVLELGVPFSDPLADGIVNQLAAQRGLESGTTPTKLLETVAELRKESQIPVVLYVYFNILHHRGMKKFIQEAAAAGVDGFLVLDLPPEESGDYEALMREAGMRAIYLVAPTTPDDRVEKIVKRGMGFIYYVSRTGVTGMRADVASSLGERTRLIRENTDLPVAVGFGVSTPEQVAEVSESCDAVVVGSAIVNAIAEHGQSDALVAEVSEVVGKLIAPLKNS